VEAFLRDWGYLGVFVGILLTGLGFPMPEELPIVLGGALAGGQSAVWWIMLPVCIVGVVIGDSFLYLIGRLWGARLVQSPFVMKRVLSPEQLVKIAENFRKYGIRILLFARLTPGIRAPIFLTAGITKLPISLFLLADGIYAIPGVSLHFVLGYFFTDSMVALVKGELEVVKNVIILIVIGAVTAYFTYLFLRKPVVTGSPGEMPPLAEPMSHTYESVANVLLPRHPPGEDQATESAAASAEKAEKAVPQ
jgi:membrane protein DedA with SNARE-associated domain